MSRSVEEANLAMCAAVAPEPEESWKPHETRQYCSSFFKWNLLYVLDGDSGRRTVEFRQPPGCASPDVTVNWINFAVGFAPSAKNRNRSSQLEEFVKASMPKLDGFSHGFWKGRVVGGISGGLLFVLSTTPLCAARRAMAAACRCLDNGDHLSALIPISRSQLQRAMPGLLDLLPPSSAR